MFFLAGVGLSGVEWAAAVTVGAIAVVAVALGRPVSTARISPEEAAKQTVFSTSEAHFRDDKDENGKPVKLYHGATGRYASTKGVAADRTIDEGMIVGKKGIETLYDLVMGRSEFADRPCMGKCVKQHVFKDATLPDGKPNPKPAVVETPGVWEYITYKEVQEMALKVGSHLRKDLKLGRQDKVAIWSYNRYEWMACELACHAYSLASVSVYDTLGPDAASFIVADAGCKVLVCEEKTLVKAAAALKDDVYAKNAAKACEAVLYFGKENADAVAELKKLGMTVVGFDDIIAKAVSGLLPVEKPKAEDVCTIMYTSGTTGNPKGVMLTHGNAVCTVMAGNDMLETQSSDVHLSYLPLAHIFERVIQLGLMSGGSKIAFASNASKALLPDLSVIKPTVFIGVPKVYENVRDAVKRKMTGVKATLLEKALSAKIDDFTSGTGYMKLWDTLVFNKTKAALGGRVRLAVSGGAPISKDTLEFACCALAPMMQGYGATETTAGATLTNPLDLQFGTVGGPLPSAKIKLVDVPDMNYYCGPQEVYEKGSHGALAFAAGKAKNGGEVWVGGPGVTPGYYDPSVHSGKRGIPSNGMAKKNAEDFEKDGKFNWFKTGDIGRWENGRLKIVDRKKNMFKTSLGEYVPVEEVEKVYQDGCAFADFVFLPKETKVAYVALCVVVSDSIGPVMKWAATVPALTGKDEKSVVQSKEFKEYLIKDFARLAKDKKLQSFLQCRDAKNLYTEVQPIGYQEEWVAGVKCKNGQTEQLLTATFKARRAQLDQYFGADAFSKIYPDRPADHILP
jgi:long-chain acyl-CoA synthetase